MARGDNDSGASIFPGGLDITVPNLTVARVEGALVYNTGTDPGLYVSLDAGSADYAYIGGSAGGSLWNGQTALEGVTVSVNPGEGETYTLQVGSTTTVFTFTASPSAATDVLIGAGAADTQVSLEAAINAVLPSLVLAVDYGNPDPIQLLADSAEDEITQTDGTGGDLTLYLNSGLNAWGQTRIAPVVVYPFHIQRVVTAVHVSQGYITASLPAGFEPVMFNVLVYDGSGGKGTASTQVKLCTATIATTFGTPGEPYLFQLDNAGATPFATTDNVIFFGLAKKTS